MRLSQSSRASAIGKLSAVKLVDQTLSDTDVPVADAALSVTPKANTAYAIQAALVFDGPPAYDAKIMFPAIAGAALGYTRDLDSTTAEQALFDTELRLDTHFGSRQTSLMGQLIMGATRGDLVLHWAQFTTASTDLTLKAGSYLLLTELGPA